MQTYPIKDLPADSIRLDLLLGEKAKGCFEILLQAPESNSGNLLFGTKGNVNHFIAPGLSANPAVQNLKDLYVRGLTGEKLIVSVFTR